MKYLLTSITCLICCCALYSQSILDMRITGQFENVSLQQVIHTIDQQYAVDFYYKAAWLPEKTVSFQFENTTLAEVLNQLLQNTTLTFTSYSNYAIIIAPQKDLTQEFTQEYFVRKGRQQNSSGPAEYDILTLGDSSKTSATGKAEVFGTITDAITGEYLAGATIYISDHSLSATANAEGKFRMGLPVGLYQATVQFVGYEPKTQYIRVLSNDAWPIRLVPEAFELNEVVIREKTDNSNIQSVQAGIEKLSINQIKQLPAFLGEVDVIKSLLTLPGVSTVGEGASGFNVRGGTIDQNLIMQDEALVFNSSHVLGFFSVFNPDAIKEVVLYKGNIPAQYGGRLSSVLDVKLKGSNYDTFKGQGGLGIVSSRILLEGPIVQDKTAFMMGARSSYSDWILRLMKDPDLKKSAAFFYDLNAKISHRFNNSSSLSLSYYQSYDNFQYSDQFGYAWGTQTANFTWNQIISSDLSSSFTVVYGNTNNESYDPEGFDAFTLRNGPQYFKLKENFFLTPFGNHKVNAGAEAIRYISKPETLNKRGSESGIVPEKIEKDDGQELAFYVNDEFDLDDRFSFSLGLRYSLFQQLGPGRVLSYIPGMPRQPDHIIDSAFYQAGTIISQYHGWEPRVSMKISLGVNNSVKLSYNRLYQYIHLISNTTAAVPVDIWQVSNTYIPPQYADNYSIGYFQNLRQNTWETSLELYYRNLHNVVEYKDLPELLLNDHLETELLSGIGKAYGAELSIRKVSGVLTGWLSYTYSRTFSKVKGNSTEETINQGDWFPSNFDKPHNLNLSVNIKANRRSQFAVNFNYSTGRPITAPIANYFIGATVIPHYSARNRYRIPDYHRLDVSYTIDSNIIRRKKVKGSLTFSLYNVYARNNAFSVFFRRDLQSTASAYKLSVLGSIFPAVTYNFEF